MNEELYNTTPPTINNERKKPYVVKLQKSTTSATDVRLYRKKKSRLRCDIVFSLFGILCQNSV